MRNKSIEIKLMWFQEKQHRIAWYVINVPLLFVSTLFHFNLDSLCCFPVLTFESIAFIALAIESICIDTKVSYEIIPSRHVFEFKVIHTWTSQLSTYTHNLHSYFCRVFIYEMRQANKWIFQFLYLFLFFIIICCCCFCCSSKWRWRCLLTSSFCLYSYVGKYLYGGYWNIVVFLMILTIKSKIHNLIVHMVMLFADRNFYFSFVLITDHLSWNEMKCNGH